MSVFLNEEFILVHLFGILKWFDANPSNSILSIDLNEIVAWLASFINHQIKPILNFELFYRLTFASDLNRLHLMYGFRNAHLSQ